jgi:hypothetical protein
VSPSIFFSTCQSSHEKKVAVREWGGLDLKEWDLRNNQPASWVLHTRAEREREREGQRESGQEVENVEKEEMRDLEERCGRDI